MSGLWLNMVSNKEYTVVLKIKQDGSDCKTQIMQDQTLVMEMKGKYTKQFFPSTPLVDHS
jgi:hypothetical protein